MIFSDHNSGHSPSPGAASSRNSPGDEAKTSFPFHPSPTSHDRRQVVKGSLKEFCTHSGSAVSQNNLIIAAYNAGSASGSQIVPPLPGEASLGDDESKSETAYHVGVEGKQMENREGSGHEDLTVSSKTRSSPSVSKLLHASVYRTETSPHRSMHKWKQCSQEVKHVLECLVVLSFVVFLLTAVGVTSKLGSNRLNTLLCVAATAPIYVMTTVVVFYLMSRLFYENRQRELMEWTRSLKSFTGKCRECFQHTRQSLQRLFSWNRASQPGARVNPGTRHERERYQVNFKQISDTPPAESLVTPIHHENQASNEVYELSTRSAGYQQSHFNVPSHPSYVSLRSQSWSPRFQDGGGGNEPLPDAGEAAECHVEPVMRFNEQLQLETGQRPHLAQIQTLDSAASVQIPPFKRSDFDLVPTHTSIGQSRRQSRQIVHPQVEGSRLLMHNWLTQKHRMQKGQLQAGIVLHDRRGRTSEFCIPHVETTIDLRSSPIIDNISFEHQQYKRANSEDIDRTVKFDIDPKPSFRPRQGRRPMYIKSDCSSGEMVGEEPLESSIGRRFSSFPTFFRPFRSKANISYNLRSAFISEQSPNKPQRTPITSRDLLRQLCCAFRDDKQLHHYNLALVIHELPAYQISVVLRNIVWCTMYMFSTMYYRRETSNDPWDASMLPRFFVLVDEMFMWMITWDYILSLLAASDKFRHVFSFGSINDLLTMPPPRLIISFFSGEWASQVPIHLGALRILRLTRLEGILAEVVPWINIVKLRIFSLVTGAVVIILMFASAMYFLEAPHTSASGEFTTLYDYVYFSLVTISTVGYGDFAPTKRITRAVVILAILVALVFLPSQIQKLVISIQAAPTQLGKLPSNRSDYILIHGPVAPLQLMIICRVLADCIPGCCDHILVITTNEANKYRELIRVVAIKAGIQICVIQESAHPRQMTPYFTGARAVFVMGDLSAHPSSSMEKSQTLSEESHGQQWSRLDIEALNEDQNTMLRFIGAQQLCWPTRPVCVQLGSGLTSHLITEMGAYNVVSIQHLKMKLLAKSCSDCPGFTTLMTNLYYSPLKEVDFFLHHRLSAGLLTDDLKLYIRGVRYNLYRLEFPLCFMGLDYTIAAKYLFVNYDAFLIGMSSVSKEYFLNPIGYKIGDELKEFTTWPFAGVILCSSLDTIKRISALETLAISTRFIQFEHKLVVQNQRDPKSCFKALLAYQKRFHLAHSESVVIPLQDGSQPQLSLSNPSTPRSAAEPIVKSREQMSLKKSYVGIYEITDVNIARREVFEVAGLDLIVVCGWPRGLHVFITTVLDILQCNIIILSTSIPRGFSLDCLSAYSQLCAWVKGSALDLTDLLRAGILEARNCCVFHSPNLTWNHIHMQAELQAILARQLIYALHHSDSMLKRRLSHLYQQSDKERPTHVFNGLFDHQAMPPSFDDSPIETKPPKYRFESINQPQGSQVKTPLVQLDLKTDQHIEYVTITPVKSFLLSNIDVQSGSDYAWSHHGLFILNSEFTAGRIFIEETLAGLICMSLPMSRYCVDSQIYDHFVTGAHVPMPPGMQPSSPFKLEPLIPSYAGCTFETVWDFYLRDHLKFVVGVYRRTAKLIDRTTPLDLILGDDQFPYLVISCPPPTMIMTADDCVYLIQACFVESLGMLHQQRS